jgi:DNA-binding NarL/FixJ family response regulator
VADGEELLYERERELASLAGSLDRIGEGEGLIVLVEGPAGIGKSALLLAGRQQASERGLLTLTARGSELEIDFPFGVVRQLFERELVGARRERALEGAAAPAEAVFGQLAPGGETSEDASWSALQGLYWLVLNLAAERPVLLVVDDLHWCDRPSLRFLAFLSRRIDGTGVGLLTGLRSTEPGTDPALISEITSHPSLVAIRPAPLTGAAVGEVVGHRLHGEGDAEFREACHRVTGGNPLLVRQLLSALETAGATPTAGEADRIAEVGPRAVSRTVLTRLARLPAAATAVARGVAILGDRSDVASVAELTELDPAAVAAATGELAGAEILRPGTALGFVHPLVRDAVYQAMAPGERQLRHARAARMLSASGAPAERVAAQLLEAPPSGEAWVAESLSAAAREAIAKGASDSAATYFRRLLIEPLEPPERGRAMFGLGMAEVDSSGLDAVRHLEEAVELLPDSPERSLGAHALARSLIFTGEPGRGAEVAMEMVKALPDGDPMKLGNLAVATLAPYFGADVPEAPELLRAYRELERPLGSGEKLIAAASAFDWTMREPDSRERCAELAWASIEDDELFEYDSGLTWTAAAQTLTYADREEVLDVFDRALAHSRRHSSLFHAIATNLFLALELVQRGDLQRAEELARENFAATHLWSSNVLHAHVGTTIWTLTEQGRLEDARALLDEHGPPAESQEGVPIWSRSQVELLLAERRPEQALEAIDFTRARFPWVENPSLVPWRGHRALALDMLGRRDEAMASFSENLAVAERWGSPSVVGRALRLLGTAERDEGEETLQRAIAVLEDSKARLELARALAAYGALVRRSRRPADAREALMRAYELAEACGADGLANEVRTELRASGARPRSSALSGPASLTASERRVADLAAEGRTNKEIAQELYVTPKTVEVHLSSAYRKLEISSRRELAGVLQPSSDPARARA